MKIYTKTGDDGTTSLYGGKRVSKSDPQVEAYGSVDELSSFLGLIIAKIKNKEQKLFLTNIQRDLYKIMSVLANAKDDLSGLEDKIKIIEQMIDKISLELPDLKRFILPAGSETSVWFHMLRSVCRRAERRTVVYLIDKEKNHETIIEYLNRLSDLFFVLARFFNKQQEIIV